MEADAIVLKIMLFLYWTIVRHPAQWNPIFALHQQLKLIKQKVKLSEWSTEAEKYPS